MKTKLYILFILFMFACLPVGVQAGPRDFPAGSIIIPMDQFYQPEDAVPGSGLQDGGILEAYGLVYTLLDHQDQASLAACAILSEPERSVCEIKSPHDITVYWVIDQDKTSITGPDLIIQDDTPGDSCTPRPCTTEPASGAAVICQDGVVKYCSGNYNSDNDTCSPATAWEVSQDCTVTYTEVVKVFNHATGGSPTTLTPDTTNGDSVNKITYRGGVFVIDPANLTSDNDPDLDDLAAVEAIIRYGRFSQVKVHVAQVPFNAPVFRRMQGKPPRIALMNNAEDPTKGNAEILESYLRLAGICPDNYDVLSPNQIGGVVDVGGDDSKVKHTDSALIAGGYDFLWAPHWAGIDSYDGDVNMDGVADVEEIVFKIQRFLKGGGALLAECASIETFEHSTKGRFLSDNGFAHNGGTNDEDDIIYNDVTSPYAQIGDFGGFDPEGGHLNNWRPYQDGDDGDGNFNFDVAPTEDASYNDTVTRFTIDNTGWDYYVGGYAYGKSYYGKVIYLGGHKYAKCRDQESMAEPEVHPLKLEFDKNVKDEIFTLEVGYSIGDDSDTLSITDIVPARDFGPGGRKEGLELEIDFTNAFVKKKKLENIEFRNLDTNEELDIDSIKLSWISGPNSDPNQKFKKLTDLITDIKHWDKKVNPLVNPLDLTITKSFTIEMSPGEATGPACTYNDKCEWTNVAGVRYVLNTLFHIKYDLANVEYVRAAPIVSHPWLYQGSYEYPEWLGHFRRYDMTQTVPASGIPVAAWDTGDTVSPLVPFAKDGNSDGRKVYTAEDDGNGNFSKINFDFGNIEALRLPLDLTPLDTGPGDDDDEEYLINRLRGKYWDFTADVPAYVDYPNRLGAILHSAPVVVRSGAKDSRFYGRTEVAYVGDLNGMLHAIKTATGEELWAYIPSNLLDKLKNLRGDPDADQDFAAVDGSPTAKDIYYDFDYDPDASPPEPEDPSWHTILVGTQGFGGKGIFALDITDPDPDDWEVLWEVSGENICTARACTDEPASGAAEICQDGVVKYCAGNYNSSKDTCSPATAWEVRRDCTTDVRGLGHSFRAALDKIKVRVPVLDVNGDPIPGKYYEKVEWRVYVATSFDKAVEEKGGIGVFAFDLKTGDKKWDFYSEYTDSVNDIPGAITTYDLDGDTFADRIYVGDMNGRLWELDALDGSNPYGRFIDASDPFDLKYFQIPLFSAGVGNPISVSPAITRHNGHVILIFGTGGTDWATTDNNKQYAIYYVDVTAAGRLDQDQINANFSSGAAAHTALWTYWLPEGQKVWSTPTISVGQIWFVTASGSMEKDDPNNIGSGELQVLDMEGISLLPNGDPLSIKKVRGSLFVSHGHVYATANDGTIIQLGDGDFAAGTGNRVLLKSWRHQ